MSLIDQLKIWLLDLRASWVMWLLIALFAVALVIIVERALLFAALKENIRTLTFDLEGLLRARSYPLAAERMTAQRKPASAVVAVGLRYADLGAAAAEKAMEGAVGLEKLRLERGLAYVGTLGNNAPFVGLLGTVIGIIEAFEALGHADASQMSAGAGLAPQAIMSGIAEALVSTAVGLFIALPSVAAFNYFQRCIQGMLTNVRALSSVLLAHLAAAEVNPAARSPAPLSPPKAEPAALARPGPAPGRS